MRTITDVANPEAFASRHLAVAPLPFNRILYGGHHRNAYLKTLRAGQRYC